MNTLLCHFFYINPNSPEDYLGAALSITILPVLALMLLALVICSVVALAIIIRNKSRRFFKSGFAQSR